MREQEERLMPEVSVIIPVYGVEDYLADCLNSVLGQSLQNLEVICVDDASPDRCPEILDDFAEQDARLKVIHLKENRRQGYARNLGLEQAKGKYSYFLDSDDMIHAETLQELYETAARDRLDGIFFDSEVLFEEERFSGIDYEPLRKKRYEERVYGGQELFEQFYEADDWNVYIWRQFWRTDFLKENRICFPESTEHEDESFSVEAAVLAKRVRYLPKAYAIHRYRADSVMTRAKSPRDFHGYFKVFRELALFKKDNHIKSPAYDDNLARLYELIELYYPLFVQEDRAGDWFPEQSLREEYELFASEQEARSILGQRIRNAWEPLMKYNHVFLYGAGRIAKRVIQQIRMTALNIEGILVTTGEGNPVRVENYPVIPLAEWAVRENTAVVMSVAESVHREVAALLEGKECDIYAYYHGHVYPFRNEK